MAVSVGDVVVVPLRQATGRDLKPRPALVLATLPRAFQTVLVAGISSDLKCLVPDWDEPLSPADGDFASTGLLAPSSVRLSYLYAADETEFRGRIGEISRDRVERIRRRLSDWISTAHS